MHPAKYTLHKLDKQESKLAELQRWVQQSLLQPWAVDQATIAEHISASERLNAERHFGIYQRSYVARLRECMARQFPALEHALEQELFCQFADQYLQTYPSTSYTLMDLGAHFERFLEETRPDRGSAEKESWPDFLIELVRFEYNLNLIFDEPSDVEPNPARLEAADDVLKLVPVFHLMEFRFPIPAYHRAFKKGEEPELPFEQDAWCAIFRVNFRLAVQGLNFWQYSLLALLEQGKTIPQALEQLSSSSPVSVDEVNAQWLDWRQDWISAGMFYEE